MTTARKIITKAMQKAGIITKNETPASDEANDALDSLNALISSWSNESILIYARTLESFTLTANDGVYTIGTSGDFNTARPLNIVSAYVRIDNTDYGMGIVDDEAFASISYKALTGLPEALNYDNGYPLGTIKLYPVPSQNYTLYLLTEKPLATLTLDTEVSLPSGWERALVYNLAVELDPEYGQPVDQINYEIAKASKAEIARSVMKNRTMDVLWRGFGNIGNVYTGWWN